MFRTRVSCRGLSRDVGERAPAGILEEFTYRSWHRNVRSEWDGTALWLEAENDYDANGMALLDEFWDAVIACVKVAGTIRLAVEFVLVVAP